MASITFVADFDMTITQKDTSYLAYEAKNSFINANNKQNEMLDEWRVIGKNYYENYLATIDNTLMDSPLSSKFDLISLQNFTEKVDQYNLKSRVNLAETKMFNDVFLGYADLLSGEIIYYPSALDILKEFNEDSDILTKVLSVNWFPELIKYSLEDIVDPKSIVTAHLPKKCSVKMNDTCWPYIDFGPCASAFDKHKWIVKWKKDLSLPLVYVGDSTTDLLALTEATYGIIFGDSSNTVRVAKHFGIALKPLTSFTEDISTSGKVLYTTCSWIEIGDFIDALKKRLGL